MHSRPKDQPFNFTDEDPSREDLTDGDLTDAVSPPWSSSDAVSPPWSSSDEGSQSDPDDNDPYLLHQTPSSAISVAGVDNLHVVGSKDDDEPVDDEDEN